MHAEGSVDCEEKLEGASNTSSTPSGTEAKIPMTSGSSSEDGGALGEVKAGISTRILNVILDVILGGQNRGLCRIAQNHAESQKQLRSCFSRQNHDFEPRDSGAYAFLGNAPVGRLCNSMHSAYPSFIRISVS